MSLARAFSALKWSVGAANDPQADRPVSSDPTPGGRQGTKPASLAGLALSLSRGPVARGSLVSIVIKVVALGLVFLQAVLMARLLGPEGFGTVAVALSVATIAATAAMLGFGPLAVREVSRLSVRADWPALGGFLRFSGFAVCGASMVAGGVIAALALRAGLFDAHFRREIALIAVLVPPLAAILYLRGVLQGFGRILAAQVSGDLLRPLIMVGCLGFLLVSGQSPTTTEIITLILAAAGLGAGLAVFSLARTLRTLPRAGRPKTDPHRWGRSAAPFFAIFVLGVVGTEAGTLILGWLAGPKEAGLFQPVARLAPIMLIANEAIAMPLAPRLAACWEKRDLRRIRHLCWLATRFATLGTVAVVLGMVLLAPLIFSAFGKEFLVNTHLLLWVGLAQIMNTATGPAAHLLAMAGAMRLRIAAQGLTMVVQLGLGLALIGPFGAEGAAIALVSAILVWGGAHWIFAKWALGIDTSLLAIRRD